jgi:hypothetical protein
MEQEMALVFLAKRAKSVGSDTKGGGSKWPREERNESLRGHSGKSKSNPKVTYCCSKEHLGVPCF